MPENGKNRRVLIVDDQTLFAETLRRSLLFEKFIRVEFETSTVEKLIYEKVATFRPDLILMDIHLNGLDGFHLTKKILAEHPDIIILMLTAFGYEEYIQKAMDSGSSGILLKDVSMDELIKSIIWASKDNFLVSKKTRMAANSGNSPDLPKWVSYLNDKEIEILKLIAKGYSNDEISAALNLGKQTIKNYVSKLYSEMKVTNRFQAIRTILEVFPESKE